jgi:CheY-like chemotaxis protein
MLLGWPHLQGWGRFFICCLGRSPKNERLRFNAGAFYSIFAAGTWLSYLPYKDTGMSTKSLPVYRLGTPVVGGQVSKRILIVDDGEEVRQVIRAVFEARTGYEICGEATNGAEAVQKALELKPDLMLLDVAMPLLNGVEVASVLAGSMPGMPIVLYTMYSELLGLSLAAAVGAKAVISKADGINKLIECVQNLLEPKAEATEKGSAAAAPLRKPALPTE